jgi:hypothetical protein
VVMGRESGFLQSLTVLGDCTLLSGQRSSTKGCGVVGLWKAKGCLGSIDLAWTDL